MGRVVKTHSTYIEGLITCLRDLAQQKAVSSVIPGRISRNKSSEKQFKLTISTEIRGGHKLIAKKAGFVQEVFVITTLGKDSLNELISAYSKR